MVFVFGIDIPLVELIFVLTLILILLFGLMIYLIISQVRLNRMLEKVLANEDIELKNLKEMRQEERDELRLLRLVRAELDKLIHGKEYGKRAGYLVGPRVSENISEEERIKRLSAALWTELLKLRKTGEEKKRIKTIRILESEKKRIESHLQQIKKPQKEKKGSAGMAHFRRI
ncbi:hypothetical protein KY349_02545 [Candidatus Woesearchaeota archaeon]|jgi:hypothetical protein|nr:hypothetical protein [Candidatus Woesearchaeota archaeon]